MGRCGGVFRRSWRRPGGILRTLMVRFFCALFWVILRVSRRRFGDVLGRLGDLVGRFGHVWICFEFRWGFTRKNCLGGSSRWTPSRNPCWTSSWGDLGGVFWGILGCLRGVLKGVLASLVSLEASWGVLIFFERFSGGFPLKLLREDLPRRTPRRT